MPRQPSAGVQIAAGHLAYWMSRGLTFDAAVTRMEASGQSFRSNTLNAGRRYAESAIEARSASEILPTDSTLEQLYGGPSNLQFDTIAVRVLVEYKDANGSVYKTASKVIELGVDDTLQDAYDMAERQLEDSLGSGSAADATYSLIASVPFPPQSAQ